jgi:TP901 family phage tail tape measure protein
MFENLAVGISVRLQDSASPGLQRLGRLLANVAEKMDRGTARARNFAANLRGNLSSAVDNVSRKFRRLRHGMNSMAQGFHEARMAMVIFTAGVGVSVAAAAKFENQMAVVRSVLGLSIADTKELENEMKRLGATTVFTATEAAEGAEKLGRAGFSMRETMAALPGVLNMAAAEGMDLARASTIASNTLRQFNLDASESDRVADVLAQTSRKTNTSIEQLGQGLKFAAPFASTLGISLEDTSLALGVLANRGLVAEMGGTSFRNMLIRMTSATRTTKAAFAELGFAVTDEDFKDMGGLFEKLSIVLGKIPTKTERAAFVAKAFGVRGMNAAVGMADAFTDMNKRLTETGSSWSDLTKSIHNATGVAQEMASVRLDSMIGALTLLKSAMEGLAIEVWLPFLRATGPMVRVIANAVQAVVAGVAKWESPIVTMKDEMSKLSLGAHRLFFRIGQGMGRGVDDLINFTKRIRDLVQSFFNAVRPTNEFLNGIGRFVVLGAVAGAALTALSWSCSSRSSRR